MVSQSVMVPVVLREGPYGKADLEKLGEVERVAEGWVLKYISRVNYLGDDETFIYNFWSGVGTSGVKIRHDDLIRFEWGGAEKVKPRLPR